LLVTVIFWAGAVVPTLVAANERFDDSVTASFRTL